MYDTHAHLDYYENTNQIIEESFKNGITHINTICVEIKNIEKIKQIAEKYENIYWSIGQHPSYILTEADIFESEYISNIIKNEKKIIGIGETGLDKIEEVSDFFKEMQIKSFNNHILSSIETKKTIIIHNRESSKKIMNTLSNYKNKNISGVIHCFTGDHEFLKFALDFGFYISISGIITFKNAQNLRDLIKYIPTERLLVETDSPYLSPEPIRNQKINKPYNVLHTIEKISELKKMEISELKRITTENGLRCFQKI